MYGAISTPALVCARASPRSIAHNTRRYYDARAHDFLRLCKNPHNIWLSDNSDFPPPADVKCRARHMSERKSRRRNAANAPVKPVEIFFAPNARSNGSERLNLTRIERIALLVIRGWRLARVHFAPVERARRRRSPAMSILMARRGDVPPFDDRRSTKLGRCGDAARGGARSDAELGLEQIVHRLRVGLAARRLHHLADEPADRARASPWPAPPCRDCSAMMSSTTFSIAARSVTCFMPRASTIACGSPPSVQTISNKSLAILPEIVPAAIRSRIAPSCAGRHRRGARCPCPPC